MGAVTTAREHQATQLPTGVQQLNESSISVAQEEDASFMGSQDSVSLMGFMMNVRAFQKLRDEGAISKLKRQHNEA